MKLEDLEYLEPWEWPANAHAMIRRKLRDPRTRTSDRVAAAGMAGELVVMDEDMAELLLSIVENPLEPEEVRARAATSFGAMLEQTDLEGYDDPYEEPPVTEATFERVKDTLHRVFADPGAPKELRRRALEASVRAQQDWHEDAVREIYASPDEEWKLTAAFCMHYVRGFDEEILDLLKSGNPDIHFEAVRAAGASQLGAAWDHIVSLLTSKSTEKPLLLVAIEAAASIRPREAQEILWDFTDSEDEDIAGTAEEALTSSRFQIENEDAGEFDEDEEDFDADEDEDEDEDEEDWDDEEDEEDEEDEDDEDWDEDEDWEDDDEDGDEEEEWEEDEDEEEDGGEEKKEERPQ